MLVGSAPSGSAMVLLFSQAGAQLKTEEGERGLKDEIKQITKLPGALLFLDVSKHYVR